MKYNPYKDSQSKSVWFIKFFRIYTFIISRYISKSRFVLIISEQSIPCDVPHLYATKLQYSFENHEMKSPMPIIKSAQIQTKPTVCCFQSSIPFLFWQWWQARNQEGLINDLHKKDTNPSASQSVISRAFENILKQFPVPPAITPTLSNVDLFLFWFGFLFETFFCCKSLPVWDIALQWLHFILFECL